MNEERKKILELLAAGKITVEESEKLLAAISSPETGAGTGTAEPGAKPPFKYLRVVVEPGPGAEHAERVNIRVPYKLIRAGLKWASFIPKDVQNKVCENLQEKGINFDFNRIKPEDIEELVSELNDLTVEVEGKEKVRIFCEM